MRNQYPGSVPESLRDLRRDLDSAEHTIVHLLQYNLSGGLVRNLQGARRELQKLQQSVAAAVVIAEMEAFADNPDLE